MIVKSNIFYNQIKPANNFDWYVWYNPSTKSLFKKNYLWKGLGFALELEREEKWVKW